MSEYQELPIFDLLGEAKLTAIVQGFYRRVPEDPILGPMYQRMTSMAPSSDCACSWFTGSAARLTIWLCAAILGCGGGICRLRLMPRRAIAG